MPHKFKKGDLVYFRSEEHPALNGFYSVIEINKAGTVYRIQDSNKEYTDVDEDEIVKPNYAIFTEIRNSWPIIVPVFDTKLYDYFTKRPEFRLEVEGTIEEMIEEQTRRIKELNEKES